MAGIPAFTQGMRTTTLSSRPERNLASSTIDGVSWPVTSTKTGPGTMDSNSKTTSGASRPTWASMRGAVTTPSTICHSMASRRASGSAVST